MSIQFVTGKLKGDERKAIIHSIDTNFIRRGLLDSALRLFQRKATTSIEENNIALALSIEPFRRLLGIRILEYIAQSVATRR